MTTFTPEELQASGTRYCEIATRDEPFVFASGYKIGPVTIAYETFGELNAERNNAVLVFHALTGSHHAAGHDPVGPDSPLWNDECQEGWWSGFIGPGCALDTDRYFIVCGNYIGGCYGSTGPSSIDPESGQPYGSRFPGPCQGC